jgi:hypothetical protein
MPSPGPPQLLTSVPAASNSNTGGAAEQQRSADGGFVPVPISVFCVKEFAPLWTIQT